MAGGWFVNPGTNLTCPRGGLSIWTGLQGSEDVGAAITTSDADKDALNGRKAQADQIFWVARVVLRVIAGLLTTQQEVKAFCYTLHRLLGP